MDLNGRGSVRTRHAGGRTRWRVQVVALAVCVAALAIPINAAGASGTVGGRIGTGREGRNDLLADRPARREPRGEGRPARVVRRVQQARRQGTNHAKLQAVVCDSRGDANGEVNPQRQMVDEGVVATLNDLTFNNPAGVNGVLEGAKIPRVGIGETDISEFQSTVSFPVSAGVIAAYLGTAVGFKEDGNTKICLVRTDAPTGATFKGFLTPSFTAIGIDIICDVSVATGATDYAPYIAQLQQENPDAVLISHTDAVTRN